MIKHESELWQTNTDVMVLRCMDCKKTLRTWDIARETVLVSDVLSSWSEHERDAQ